MLFVSSITTELVWWEESSSSGFDKRGLGLDYALELAAKRGKGIVYFEENCYGPDGAYHERRGYQQIADAASGASYVMGKAFGYPDGQGIVPALPISDISTGTVGAIAVASMLRDRARYGGSYTGAAALTAYNVFTLTKEVGLYQPDIVQKIRDKYKFKPITSASHCVELYYEVMHAWKDNSELVSNEEHFVHFFDSVYGSDFRLLKPVIRYTDEKASPHWTSPPVPFCHHQDDVSWSGKV